MNDLIRREDVLRLAECGKLLSGFYGERAKDIIKDIPTIEPKDTLLPSGELLVDTEYANKAKSVRLMDREGFTREFEEPKTGHWICPTTRDDIINKDFFSECSECGGLSMDETGYCPNCGARMEGETNE